VGFPHAYAKSLRLAEHFLASLHHFSPSLSSHRNDGGVASLANCHFRAQVLVAWSVCYSACDDTTFALSLLLLGATLLAADPVADATAKFLAGMPVRGHPDRAIRPRFRVGRSRRRFDRAWTQLEQRQLSKIRAWPPQFLGPTYTDRGPMFYMFSGPDSSTRTPSSRSPAPTSCAASSPSAQCRISKASEPVLRTAACH